MSGGAAGDAAAVLQRVAVAALESSETAIAIVDASRRVSYANGALLRLWGYARADEVVGRPIAAFWKDAAAAAAASEAVRRDGRWSGELVALRADGRTANVRASASAFEDRAAGDRSTIVTFVDVTELREAQDQLLRAQRMAHLGYWWYDPPARSLRWSDETYAIMGVARDGFAGTVEALLALVHPDDAAGVRAAIDHVAADPRPATHQFRVLRAGGEERIIHAEAVPVVDAHGRVVEVRGVLQDVTSRVRLEEQLRQSQKMEAVGSLAGGIAHDFNNILTVILSLGSEAAEALPDGSQVRADVEEIVAVASRAGGLTRQILSFARKQVSEPADVDLNAMIEGTVRLLARLIGEHIQIKLSLAPGIPHVHADARQLEQVLMNVAVNARDAMSAGGTLFISTFSLPRLAGARQGRVELVVRDSGTGMDAATKARAFDPFFTTKGPGHGTGLGLAVVQGIVQQFGGTIAIDSAPGQGTAVRIVLPSLGQAAAATPAPAAAPATAVPTGRTILLVEDEDNVRRVTARTLERAGYRVLAVADGEDALRIAAATERIDLLLTDVVMPGMSGTRLADHLRAARPALPVLFMSGFSKDLPESIAPPPELLLLKPYGPETLLPRVAAALTRSSPGSGGARTA